MNKALEPWIRIGCSLLLVLASAAVAVAPAVAGDEETIDDAWTIARMAGAEVGHSHAVSRWVEKDGERLVQTEMEMTMSFGRLGQDIEMKSTATTLEDADGRLRSSRTEMKLSTVDSRVEAEVRDGKIHVKTTNYGATTEQTLDTDGDVLGTYGISRVRARHAGTPGATYSYKTFSGEMMARIVTATGKVIGPVEKEVLGEVRTLVELHEEVDIMPGLVAKAWIDDEGRSIVEYIPLTGGIETIRVSKERALAKEEPTGDATGDILLALSIASNVRLPFPYRVDSALYEIEVKEGDPAKFAERAASPRQTIEKRDGNRILLRIRKMEPAPGASYAIPYRGDKDLSEFTEPNTWLQSDDPVVVAAARAAIGDEKDAWKAAKRLERWVYEHIRNKNMTVGFASAREVCDTGEGDCSEHAVLLAAVLRAVGIPSRVSMGVVYFNGVFAGHAWTEAWIGDWIPLDATMARPFVSAVHVSFGNSSLSDEGMDALMGTGVALGNVDFEILEYTLDGRKVRIDDTFRPYEVDGDLYRNELFGLEIRKLPGWEFEDLDEAGFGTTLLEMEGEFEGGERGIRISTAALPYNQDFYSIVEQVTRAGKETISKETVDLDGREGMILAMAEGEGADRKKELHAFVTVDEMLLHFRSDYSDEGDAKAFRQVLAGLKWIGEAASR
jgi:hypothetical protein